MVTPTQHRIYEFIKAYIAKHEYAPTLMEIAHGIGVRSKSLISRYVHALAKANMIDLVPGESRQMRLKQSPTTIPLAGRIAAGRPIEAIEQQDTLDLATLFAKTQTIFALQVKGDSMIEEGIFDNDFVFCESCNTAQTGDIVVALIDEQEATLKRISFPSKTTIMLTPANATLKPQTYEADRVQIQGVYKGLIRLSSKH